MNCQLEPLLPGSFALRPPGFILALAARLLWICQGSNFTASIFKLLIHLPARILGFTKFNYCCFIACKLLFLFIPTFFKSYAWHSSKLTKTFFNLSFRLIFYACCKYSFLFGFIVGTPHNLRFCLLWLRTLFILENSFDVRLVFLLNYFIFTAWWGSVGKYSLSGFSLRNIPAFDGLDILFQLHNFLTKFLVLFLQLFVDSPCFL